MNHQSAKGTKKTGTESRPPLEPPVSITVCFALASYAVVVTGTALACAIWLPAFEVPAGTPSYRPMGQTANCFFVGAGTTLLGLGFAVAVAASNPRRTLVWILSICLAVLSLAPLPVAWRFSKWVLATQGLELSP